MRKSMHEFTNENFRKEVLSFSGGVLVDFWAEWCGPCKAISPVINELASEFDGKFKIGKVNVDENPDITQQLCIFNIPTLIFFKDGKEVSRMVGINPKAEIAKRIEELI